MDDSRLKKIPLFADLSKNERSTLAGLVEEYEEPEGTTLVGQGDYGYEFIVIEDGTVDVIHDGKRIDSMGPGEFFGEAALRSGALRNASIVATSAVNILALSAHNIKVVRDQMPDLAEQLDGGLDQAPDRVEGPHHFRVGRVAAVCRQEQGQA